MQCIRVCTVTGASMKTTFSTKRVIYNGQQGWIVEMRINGVFAGRCFGRTKAAAKEQLQVQS